MNCEHIFKSLVMKVDKNNQTGDNSSTIYKALKKYRNSYVINYKFIYLKYENITHKIMIIFRKFEKK